jgi:hypothetical protein
MNPPITKRFTGKALKITHRKALKWLLSTYIRIVNPILGKKALKNGLKRTKKGLLSGSPFYYSNRGYVLQRNVTTFVTD